MIHHKPLRSTWSQLSAVSVYLFLSDLWHEKTKLWKLGLDVVLTFSASDPVTQKRKTPLLFRL